MQFILKRAEVMHLEQRSLCLRAPEHLKGWKHCQVQWNVHVYSMLKIVLIWHLFCIVHQTPISSLPWGKKIESRSRNSLYNVISSLEINMTKSTKSRSKSAVIIVINRKGCAQARSQPRILSALKTQLTWQRKPPNDHFHVWAWSPSMLVTAATCGHLH